MKYILSAIIAGALAGPALAQALDFTALDIDQSGSITMPELQAVLPDMTEEQFTAADTDGSGDISPEEFAVIAGG